MMDDDVFVEGAFEYALSPGTCEMYVRCSKMIKRPTPPEIRTAARFFRADWRAVAILTGWAPTKEGDWRDMEADDFTWEGVAPECTFVRAKGPASEHWNQELAALAIMRTIRR